MDSTLTACRFHNRNAPRTPLRFLSCIFRQHVASRHLPRREGEEGEHAAPPRRPRQRLLLRPHSPSRPVENFHVTSEISQVWFFFFFGRECSAYKVAETMLLHTLAPRVCGLWSYSVRNLPLRLDLCRFCRWACHLSTWGSRTFWLCMHIKLTGKIQPSFQKNNNY